MIELFEKLQFIHEKKNDVLHTAQIISLTAGKFESSDGLHATQISSDKTAIIVH